jgi:hypothetical protein
VGAAPAGVMDVFLDAVLEIVGCWFGGKVRGAQGGDSTGWGRGRGWEGGQVVRPVSTE